jgi:signal transduction histidine kinase
LEQHLRRNIYLVVKEAVHNIVRHANASEVKIDIQITKDLLIAIRDNGCGIRAGEGNRFGNGMKNMQWRMAQINGTFNITADGGTCIILKAPLQTLPGNEIA